jgi:ABC-type nitrate/sulfonate/bicarbonate transport system ATPase subunit
MWTVMQHTIFMVTHNVDEAILLSDRIALMTNGPDPRLAETVAVDIPRPRSRETMIDTASTRGCATTCCIFCCAAHMPSRRMPSRRGNFSPRE